MIGIANKSFVQILAYCQYVSIYWNMADLAAFGHISANLRIQAWKFELPPSLDSIASFSQECQYRQNRYFTTCLSKHRKSHDAK